MQRFTTRPWRAALTGAALVLLSGCATERVILLDDKEGGTGAIEMRTDRHVLVIDAPLTEATVGLLGGIDSMPADRVAIEQTFSDALAAMPPPPRSFVLYFEEGTTRLMPPSVPVMQALLEDIERNPVADIQVTGHTDRVGTIGDNDVLAANRAGFVRRMLLSRGLTDRVIRAVGRGERELLVPTEDEVEEPRNRRVEVIVR